MTADSLLWIGCWIEGGDFERLPETIRELVCERPGWTPRGWADYLRQRAAACNAEHTDTRLLYLRAAETLGAANVSGRAV